MYRGLGLSPELEAALKREADNYVKKVLGELYELIPRDIRESMEREYIERRMEEMQVKAAGVAGKVTPGLIIGGLVLLMFLRR